MKYFDANPSLAYACLNAIGNSSVMEEMLNEVISTFADLTDASGGKFRARESHGGLIISVKKEFDLPEFLAQADEPFRIHHSGGDRRLLDIPMDEGHFLFCYDGTRPIDLYGEIFSGFKTKLAYAIAVCRDAESLQKRNTALENQILEIQKKNEISERMMISQSRMAIMGEMLGMIAHQWRQPITVIGMITNNTIMGLEFDDINRHQLLEDMNVIDKQVHYLSDTIDDFRNFFKPNKVLESITWREVSNDLSTMLGKTYKNSGIALTFEGNGTTAFVTYKNELMQVFLNILTNAKDIFEERRVQNPSILFKAFGNEEMITFSIQDNAGGIEENIIDKIFDPYFSTKKEMHGTGLGLYMSAIIIEKHLNGSIHVSSDTDGAIFTLSIPTNYQKDMTYVF